MGKKEQVEMRVINNVVDKKIGISGIYFTKVLFFLKRLQLMN